MLGSKAFPLRSVEKPASSRLFLFAVKLRLPSRCPKRHGDERLVAVAFDEQQHRLAAGLAGIGDCGLDVAGIVDRSVVHRDDDIARLDAGGSRRPVRVDLGDNRAADRARQIELLAHIGREIGKADAEARLAGALVLGVGAFSRGLLLPFLIGADGDVEIDGLAVAPDAE